MTIARLGPLSICVFGIVACTASPSDPSSTDDPSVDPSTATEALSASHRGSHHVYALTNERAANAVLAFDRAEDGTLALAGRVATGGEGSDDGLGSEGSLTLSQDGRWLLASNAGSRSVSLLRITDRLPRLVMVTSSGGDRPVSIAERDGLVYVLNAGTEQNISGFRLEHERLWPIAGSTRSLSASTPVGAAQVAFSPDGNALVVTEKATNHLDGFVVRFDGTPSNALVSPSVGDTPFGFAFDRNGVLVVSDAYGGAAGAGALSSYTLDASAAAHTVSRPVKNGQGAPCWVVTTADARFAYVANTGSGTISGYALDGSGALGLFADAGATAHTGSAPADLALSRSGQLLYVRDGDGTLDGFFVGHDGRLEPADSVGGLPPHTAGIAAD